MKKKVVKKTKTKTKGPIVKVVIPTADIQAFESSKLRIEQDLIKVADLLAPYTESMKLFQERISEMYKPLFSVADIYGNHFEAMKDLQKQLLAPSLRIAESLKPILDSSKVFESLALSQASIAKQLQGLVINLPLEGYFKTLSASASFELTLDKFTSIKSHPNDYLLTGNAVQTTQHERIGLKLTTGFEMRLTSIESKIEANNTKLDYLIEKDARRDVLLEELVDYVKSTGSQLAKVLNVGYNHSNTEITIDNLQVKLQGNTNQSEICKVLLASKNTIKKVWDMDEVKESIDGDRVDTKDWNRIIYDAVKEVNTKILIESKGVT